MIGSIIGDIIGSPYEFSRIKSKDLTFKTRESNYTDDTVCIIATMDWINKGIQNSYAEHLIHWCWKYPNPMGGYGAGFKRWLMDSQLIFGKVPPAYNSFGNGAAMRVSPIALYLKNDIVKAKGLTIQNAKVTHDHPEGIKGAQATVTAIILAYNKYPKDYIRKQIQSEFGYDMDFKLDQIRAHYPWNETCQESVPQAIACFLEGRNYEDTLRNCLSLGGDADTLCAIAGGIADAYYEVPRPLAAWGLKKLPEDMIKVINTFYNETIK